MTDGAEYRSLSLTYLDELAAWAMSQVKEQRVVWPRPGRCCSPMHLLNLAMTTARFAPVGWRPIYADLLVAYKARAAARRRSRNPVPDIR